MDNKDTPPKRVCHYDLLRLLLVILVVIGYVYFYQIHTGFGGIYIADDMETANITDSFAHKVIL